MPSSASTFTTWSLQKAGQESTIVRYIPQELTVGSYPFLLSSLWRRKFIRSGLRLGDYRGLRVESPRPQGCQVIVPFPCPNQSIESPVRHIKYPNSATMNSTIKNDSLVLASLLKSSSCLSVTTYKIITGFTVPLALSSVCMYLGVLVTFARRPSLINHFTIHLVSLSVINILYDITCFPLSIARPIAVDSGWLNHPFSCAVLQYFVLVLPIMIILQDMVICGDRWVRLLAPVWFRNHQNIKFGLAATLAAAIWLHGWYLPLNILNYLTPMNLRQGCDGTAYPGYRALVSITVLYIPQVLTFGSYPFLLFLLWRRKRRQSRLRRGRVDCLPSGPQGSLPLPAQSQTETTRQDDTVKTDKKHTQMAIYLLLLKLISNIVITVPTAMVILSATLRRQPPPCTWDAFHLSEHFLSLAQLGEPFIYLANMRDLRREFLRIFINL
ncbi:hypothetical protein BV898_17971 [Hypsibius exemplaris]|uniref:G-protein coupled receptors family 1 profile domain-containing protein n=1 Tax=Hypsibius exemplaris TaxID=2072580 RepID=A0A9X6NIJ5_HYPEX|nr:hypothetical protein BV898_17971 [Hypsibius exemplaris]